VSFVHANTHIREIVLAQKVRGQWMGHLTVVRPPGTKEYVWSRRLTSRERRTITQHFVQAPADVAIEAPIEAPIVDIYYSQDVGRWLSRPVSLET
jgi:hypothetical protein